MTTDAETFIGCFHSDLRWVYGQRMHVPFCEEKKKSRERKIGTLFCSFRSNHLIYCILNVIAMINLQRRVDWFVQTFLLLRKMQLLPCVCVHCAHCTEYGMGKRINEWVKQSWRIIAKRRDSTEIIARNCRDQRNQTQFVKSFRFI